MQFTPFNQIINMIVTPLPLTVAIEVNAYCKAQLLISTTIR